MRRCYFCNREGAAVCDSPECQQYDRELSEYLEEEARSDLHAAVRAALVKRCKDDWNDKLNRCQRWFYTAKCLLCVMLRWEGRPAKPVCPDRVVVACHHYAKLYAGWESRHIEVGRGVFTQWWFQIESDGDSWM